jgi:hypothetical protein
MIYLINDELIEIEISLEERAAELEQAAHESNYINEE